MYNLLDIIKILNNISSKEILESYSVQNLLVIIPKDEDVAEYGSDEEGEINAGAGSYTFKKNCLYLAVVSKEKVKNEGMMHRRLRMRHLQVALKNQLDCDLKVFSDQDLCGERFRHIQHQLSDLSMPEKIENLIKQPLDTVKFAKINKKGHNAFWDSLYQKKSQEKKQDLKENTQKITSMHASNSSSSCE
jgi:hypothetical protein